MKKHFTTQELGYVEVVLQSFDSRYPQRPTTLSILMKQQEASLPAFAEKSIIDACLKSGIATTKYDVNYGQLLYPADLAFSLLTDKKTFSEYLFEIDKENGEKIADRELMKKSIAVAEDSYRMSKRNTLWVIIGVGIAFLALIASVVALLK